MRMSGSVLALAAIGLALAGCKPGGGVSSSSTASQAPPAVSAAPTASAQGPAPTETPAHFAMRVLDVYRSGSPWWSEDTSVNTAYQKRVYAEFYDPEFPRLMDENSTLAGQKAGGVDLDYDPVCQCQDEGGTDSVVSVTPSGDFVDVKILRDDHTTWTLVLTQAAGGWRLYDVIDQTGSIRALLQKHDACMKAARTEKAGEACVT